MRVRLYHERQVAGLCGQHCLNTLLQGPYYAASDLGSIARELDEQERRMMLATGTDSPAFLKYMAEDSGNVADDGNFSVEVLRKALLGSFDIRLINSKVDTTAREEPSKEVAFVCNLQEHWFTLRKVNGAWFNCNSLLKEPEHITDFYLKLFMDTLVASGYEIFVARGSFPQPMAGDLDERNWKVVDTEAPKRSSSGSAATREQQQMEAAVRASLQEAGIPQEQEDDDDWELALAMSMSKEQDNIPPDASVKEDENVDEGLAAALALSQQSPM